MEDISPHYQYDGKTVISTSRLTKAFGNLVAVNDLHLEVMRGDVFGFLGPNGSGKTTLLRTIIDELPPLSGQVHIGHNVRIGYYSQTHADLNLERTIIDEIRQISVLSEEGARTFLGRFSERHI